METAQELLIKGLPDLCIPVELDTVDRFLRYLLELQKWNRAYNLTALKTAREIIIKHFFDSLLFLKAFPAVNGPVCDIGSGAGFPGIPIAIVRPDISVSLIEPSRKKCAFLKNIKKLLNLNNVEVLESRIEDIKDREFNIAVTRALFSISEFVKKTRHVVRKDGCFIVNKGPKFQNELERISPDIHLDHIVAILPLTAIERHLIRITILNNQSKQIEKAIEKRH